MSRTDMSKAQWAALEPLLPRNPKRGQPYNPHRKVINGILWRLKTGAPWRDVPRRYGPWQTCYDRFVRWSRDGTWLKLLQTLHLWWGSGTRQTVAWAGRQGLNLMSSTRLSEDTGASFDKLQAEQIAIFRDAWRQAGWEREPRVSVSRSVLPIVTDFDRQVFGRAATGDQVGELEGVRARFGRSDIGEPDVIAQELCRDAAVREADTLLTVPNQLGVAYNSRLLETIARDVAPALGWRPASRRTAPGGPVLSR